MCAPKTSILNPQHEFFLAQVRCPSPNGYFPDSKKCDTFIECRNGTGEEKTCADGLVVDMVAAAFRYLLTNCSLFLIPVQNSRNESSVSHTVFKFNYFIIMV
jgi:hypothetical protein